MLKLVAATKNKGKAKELEQILKDLPFEIVSLEEYPDAPDVEETGSTFIENAIIKAKAYADYTGELTIADDSGLEIDALNGAPGIFSSRFADNDEERNNKALDLMKNIPDDKRVARFKCAIAIAYVNGDVKSCEGSLEGIIANEPAGSNGFGYDPIMFIPEFGKTVAELTSEQKNSISHRGKALAKAKEILQNM